MNRQIGRVVASTLSLLVLAIGALVSATPAHAAVYATYKNEHSRSCLTGGKTGKVFVSTCNGSWYQQWEMISGDGHGFHRYKNRVTGECLMTDYKSQVNAVWTSPCKVVSGQLWMVDETFFNRELINLLRTSPTAGAVYSDKSDTSFDYSYYNRTETFV